MAPALVLGLALAAADVAQAGFGLVIASDSDCPSAAAVRDQLASLKYPSPDAGSVAVHADEAEVTVSFGAPAGVSHGPRRLALASDCPRRASTVALLIATWLGQIPQGPAPSLTMEIPPPPSRPPRPARRPPPAPVPWVSEAGVGVSGFAQRSTLVPALRLELGRGPVSGGTGWQLSAVIPLPRSETQEVPEHAVLSWMRPTVMYDLRWRSPDPPSAIDLDVGVGLGLAAVWEKIGRSATGWAAGVNGAVRYNRSVGTFAPWLEMRSRLWFTRQKIQSYSFLDAELPLVEIEVAMGASLPL
jgi:hypothetical protein